MSDYTGGIKINLTEEGIKEAIDWGAKDKNSYGKNVSEAYRFGKPLSNWIGEWVNFREATGKKIDNWSEYKESGSIYTKFFSLATLGGSLAREGKSPERADIEKILNMRTMMVYIHTYGDKGQFAKNYRIVLKQGEKLIQPVEVKADGLACKTAFFPKSPSFSACVEARFLYSEIDPKAKTTIILVKDQGESRFEVDFSRYK